jgi:hypothetical protein
LLCALKGDGKVLAAAIAGKLNASSAAKYNAQGLSLLGVVPAIVGVRSQAKIRGIAFIHIPRVLKDKCQTLAFEVMSQNHALNLWH